MPVDPQAQISVALYSLQTQSLDHHLATVSDEERFEQTLLAAEGVEQSSGAEAAEASAADEDKDEARLSLLIAML